jgi:hypothetical protein
MKVIPSGRIWRALTIALAVPVLFLAVSYPVGQERAREDPKRCTPSTDPASRRWVPPDVVARPEFRKGIQDCIDGSREERWGPWDAWNRFERVERLLGRNDD